MPEKRSSNLKKYSDEQAVKAKNDLLKKSQKIASSIRLVEKRRHLKTLKTGFLNVAKSLNDFQKASDAFGNDVRDLAIFLYEIKSSGISSSSANNAAALFGAVLDLVEDDREKYVSEVVNGKIFTKLDSFNTSCKDLENEMREVEGIEQRLKLLRKIYECHLQKKKICNESNCQSNNQDENVMSAAANNLVKSIKDADDFNEELKESFVRLERGKMTQLREIQLDLFKSQYKLSSKTAKRLEEIQSCTNYINEVEDASALTADYFNEFRAESEANSTTIENEDDFSDEESEKDETEIESDVSVEKTEKQNYNKSSAKTNNKSPFEQRHELDASGDNVKIGEFSKLTSNKNRTSRRSKAQTLKDQNSSKNERNYAIANEIGDDKVYKFNHDDGEGDRIIGAENKKKEKKRLRKKIYN